MEIKKNAELLEMKLHGFYVSKNCFGGDIPDIKLVQLLGRGFRDVVQSSKKKAEVQPDLITYSTLLKGYCQVGHLKAGSLRIIGLSKLDI